MTDLRSSTVLTLCHESLSASTARLAGATNLRKLDSTRKREPICDFLGGLAVWEAEGSGECWPPTCIRAQRPSAIDADAGSEVRAIDIARLEGGYEERQLDREKVQVTAGSRQERQADTDVRLTGLIPRLTSPSRNHAELVDIWFGLERLQQTFDWDEAFTRIAEGCRPDPRQPSHFELLSHPSSSALIVARQVSRNRAAWREIETEARGLVNRVNRAVAEQRARPAQTRRTAGWSLRGKGASPDATSRNWIGEMAHLFRGLVPKPSLPVSQSSSTGVR